jgi:hypothetical protein
MLHALTSWFFPPRRSPARPSRTPTRFRPRLEALEDRSLPSANLLSGLPTATLSALNPSASTSVATSVSLISSSGATARYGQGVTFTALLTPTSSGGQTPTGTVVFSVDGNAASGKIVVSHALATWSTSALTVGPHTITASYSGDSHFAASTAAALSLTVAPQMTLTSSSVAIVIGQSVTLTATLAAPGLSAVPTGSVNFYATAGQNSVWLGSGQLQTGTNTSSASLRWTPPALGQYLVSAAYSGDSNYSSTTAILTSHGQPVRVHVMGDGIQDHPLDLVRRVVPQVVTTLHGLPQVSRKATILVLHSSPSSIVVGQSVTFTATVFALSGTPTGSANFYDGSTFLGSSPLQLVHGADQATWTTTSLSAGTHWIKATYTGDSNFAPSSADLTNSNGTRTPIKVRWDGGQGRDGHGWPILRIATPFVARSSGLAGDGQFNHIAVSTRKSTRLVLRSAAPQSLAGQAATFTATVAAVPAGAGQPTGWVDFYVNGVLMGSSALQVIGHSDQATWATTSLGIGTYWISAIYTGDSQFAPSSGVLVGRGSNRGDGGHVPYYVKRGPNDPIGGGPGNGGHTDPLPLPTGIPSNGYIPLDDGFSAGATSSPSETGSDAFSIVQGF